MTGMKMARVSQEDRGDTDDLIGAELEVAKGATIQTYGLHIEGEGDGFFPKFPEPEDEEGLWYEIESMRSGTSRKPEDDTFSIQAVAIKENVRTNVTVAYHEVEGQGRFRMIHLN